MGFIAFWVGLLALMFVADKIINKLVRAEKKRVSETPGENLDRWGKGVLLISFLIAQRFMINNNSDVIISIYWMTYLALNLIFQVTLELIYIKKSKQHISTFILLLMVIVVMCVLFKLR